MEKDESVILEKKIECVLGIVFVIPPILGVVAFLMNLFDIESFNHFSSLSNLSFNWTGGYGYSSDGGGGGAMSATPLYLGLMAIAGAYLIKNNIRYFFLKK